MDYSVCITFSGERKRNTHDLVFSNLLHTISEETTDSQRLTSASFVCEGLDCVSG